jgi:predicted transcriptional regulator
VDCDSIAPFDKSTGIYIGKQCCLSREELWKYTSGHCAHGWHISDLKIYNKPKALSEFGLTRPPQPWRYVEVSADEP